MRVANINGLSRTAWGLHHFCRTTLTLDQATAALKQRLARREDAFLQAAKSLIFAHPAMPYCRLLRWAGCEFGDLERSVRQGGIEVTLERLRDAGVYVSLEEFERKQPICRPGLTLNPDETDFDNPAIASFEIAWSGTTSATRSAGKRVSYSWDLLTDGAANELALYAAHELLGIPLAVWYPPPPSLAGLNNVLTNAKFGSPPERWFSHYKPGEHLAPRTTRLALAYLDWTTRLYGTRIPRPESTPLTDAKKVAEWMARTKAQQGTCILRTYTSSAVRVAEAARTADLDITGCTIFVGGEPLTPRRHQYITSIGAKVYARYVITELGHVAGGCPHASGPDAMHLYTDRLAVIPDLHTDALAGAQANALLFTSLSSHAPKIAFNTDFGDIGRISRHSCSCLLGQLGLDVHVTEVRSHQKLTGEGMTILTRDLDDLIGALVADAGGCPDDFQFREEEKLNGVPRLTIALSPKMYDTIANRLQENILTRLTALKGGAAASAIWGQAGAISVVRAHPWITKGFKMPAELPGTAVPAAALSHRFDPAAWDRFCDESEPQADGYVFRRGLEVTRTLCTGVAQPGERWVDVGCGTGHLVGDLTSAGLLAFGLDEDQRMVTFARSHSRRRGMPGPAPFLSARASSLPFRNQSLDGVVAVSLTGCLDNLEEFLGEVYRVLRPKGWAILTFTNRNSVLLRAHDVAGSAFRTAAPMQLRRYNPAEVMDASVSTGYRSCAIQYYNCCLTVGGRPLPSAEVARMCDQLSRFPFISKRFARNFVVVAQK